jgi:hypothetical protein
MGRLHSLKRIKIRSGQGRQKAPKMQGGCRPCDQPHFFMSDTNGDKRHALLVAVTERRTRAQIDSLAMALAGALA